MARSAQQEHDQARRIRSLYDFFYYTVRVSTISDLSAFLQTRFSRLLEQEDSAYVLQLYEELGQDKAFRAALKEDFSVVLAFIRAHASTEDEA